MCGRKEVIAGADLIAGVPRIRVLDGIRIQVPAVVVPVRADSPELYAIRHPCDIPSFANWRTWGQNYVGPRSLPAYRADSFFFQSIIIPPHSKKYSE
jgi:hypothetical protein